MGRYLIRRGLWALFTLWSLATLVFFLLRLFPGGPFDDELAIQPEIRAALEKAYHISGSPIENYFAFLSSCLKGDFGQSMYFPGETVSVILARAIQSTFLLNGGAFLCVIGFGLLLGLLPHLVRLSAKPVRMIERLSLALPILFLGPLLLWLLGFHWGVVSLRVNEQFTSYLLPIFLLSFRPICFLARVLDMKISQAEKSNYAQTHRSLGMSERRLIVRWLLRPCSPAFVQMLPSIAAGLFSGSLLIEVLFSIQGLGFYFSESLLNRDWSLALGITLFYGMVLIAAQMLADIMMMILDPRVRVR